MIITVLLNDGLLPDQLVGWIILLLVAFFLVTVAITLIVRRNRPMTAEEERKLKKALEPYRKNPEAAEKWEKRINAERNRHDRVD